MSFENPKKEPITTRNERAIQGDFTRNCRFGAVKLFFTSGWLYFNYNQPQLVIIYVYVENASSLKSVLHQILKTSGCGFLQETSQHIYDFFFFSFFSSSSLRAAKNKSLPPTRRRIRIVFLPCLRAFATWFSTSLGVLTFMLSTSTRMSP